MATHRVRQNNFIQYIKKNNMKTEGKNEFPLNTKKYKEKMLSSSSEYLFWNLIYMFGR